ncbi:CocE/NonD family hydrolase [Streptomyces tsukubensis]|uniref:Peptidase S15 n=1 Tax=Streptomyces tsukubensis (strain DSM 42081 / NBRC 108919 / NRRL 18488 / 9993) TaxID=1114943 RepID=A0A7G3UP02_STRT9|nr:CocE/NonD family hydrolase [Streptomyces tsukubensis]AZK92889.1 peptidase S15 [Streptomyces tsukubensis]QKM70950.1 peptidase S15 [Streptomyces tsukubensis NRRL18488]TAI41791.1 CocE/NonD family hydrolase [Streptomyces tsukubensis]
MTRTVRVPSGGVFLATDVHLPPTGPAGHPYPAVLVRTPYGRSAHRHEARAWTALGFAAVVQDVRGRYGSGGDWRPYTHEETDGAATLRWIRGRRWSNGRVVAAGSSYAAYCALVTAAGGSDGVPPDGVVAAVPALGTGETAREPSGAERLLGRAGWWAAHGDRADSDPAALDRLLSKDPGLLAHLPVGDLPARLGRALPSWPGIWQARRTDRIVRDAPAARIPLLAIGGTHDPFAADTLALWRAWGGPAGLLLGPWGHRLARDPGPGARPEHRVDTGGLTADWARAVCGGSPPAGRSGAVALAGTPHWFPADALVEPAAARRFPLAAGPLDVTLLYGADFRADPARPVRSDELRADPPRTPDEPADRALFVTAPLTRDTDLLGPAAAELHATADTPAADWFVRLVALDPQGRAEPLALGTARTTRPPGTWSTVTVPLGPLARRLPAGTRIRIEATGHHFPAHARNPHTGEDPVTAVRLLPSHRTLRPGACALLLPVTELRGSGAVPDLSQEIRT